MSQQSNPFINVNKKQLDERLPPIHIKKISHPLVVLHNVDRIKITNFTRNVPVPIDTSDRNNAGEEEDKQSDVVNNYGLNNNQKRHKFDKSKLFNQVVRG